MKKWILTLCLGAISSLALAEVTVTDATVREILPGRNMTAGYFSISNKNNVAAELTGASSPLFGSIELHRTSFKDGMMSMQQVESVVIKAGDQIHFLPGGLHLMMFDVKGSIKRGQQIPLRFTFKDGQSIEVQASVSAIASH